MFVNICAFQVSDSERKAEVIDLWSEDTKQDAWFTQSALDVGFRWVEQHYENYSVYLFSGKLKPLSYYWYFFYDLLSK